MTINQFNTECNFRKYIQVGVRPLIVHFTADQGNILETN